MIQLIISVITSFLLYQTIKYKMLTKQYEEEDYNEEISASFNLLVEYLDLSCMNERINNELFESALKIKGNIKEAIMISKLTKIPTKELLDEPFEKLLKFYNDKCPKYLRLIKCTKTKYGDKLLCEILDTPVRLDILDIIDNQFELNKIFNSTTRIEELDKDRFIIHVVKNKEFETIKSNKVLSVK